MTTHPINPLARGGYLVTVKRDGRATKVHYCQTRQEADELSQSIRLDPFVGTQITITPTGGVE